MVKAFKIGGAVGSGVVARAAEEGGADFLIALNAGRMRNMGAPSIACMLPLARADEMTRHFAEEEVLPQSKLPVYLGVNIWSGERSQAEIATLVAEKGFAGASNFPSAIHFPAAMQRLLAAAGQGVEAEINLLSAVRSAGKKALFYCGTREQAQRAAEAGLDGIIYNFGWNVGGAVGHKSQITLEEAALVARDAVRLARSIKPDIEVYLEGGPILTAQDLRAVAQTADIDGYVGGSTLDRFPVQHSVANQIAEYKSAAIAVPEYPKEVLAALRRLAEAGLVGRSQALAGFATEVALAVDGQRHIALRVEAGCNSAPVIELLARGGRKHKPQQVEYFDFETTLSVHRINDMIFGHHTDERNVTGFLENADPTTVILRNADLMPRLIARKLVTTLRTGRVNSVGRRRSAALNARIILVYEDGEPADPSLSDLFDYVQVIELPPLRKRHEDIPDILDGHFERLGLGGRRPTIQAAAFRLLAAHHWPGNDEQLSELAVQLAQLPLNRPIEAYDLQPLLEGREIKPTRVSEDTAFRQQIIEALVQNGFRKGATAKALHVSRKTLYNWMQRLDLR